MGWTISIGASMTPRLDRHSENTAGNPKLAWPAVAERDWPKTHRVLGSKSGEEMEECLDGRFNGVSWFP